MDVSLRFYTRLYKIYVQKQIFVWSQNSTNYALYLICQHRFPNTVNREISGSLTTNNSLVAIMISQKLQGWSEWLSCIC